MRSDGRESGQHVDLAIVGAGIVGCIIAREVVARTPGASVVVLERDAVGCGASRRSAGVHFPRGRTARVRRMSHFSQAYYEQLAREHPSLPLRPLAMSIVATANASAGAAGSVEETYLDSAALERVGAVANDVVRLPSGARVWRGQGCQHADVHGVAQLLARDLRGRVSLREGARVSAIEPVAHGVVLDLAGGDALTARQVVLAPGPWLAAPAWRALVAPLGARVKRVAALHIERAPGAADGAIVFHDEDAFLAPLHDRGQWLFSFTSQEWDVDPDASCSGLSAGDVDQARRSLRRYAPSLVEHCAGGRTFCDAYSTSGEPLVQALDPDGRIVFAGACNGTGYRLAPAIAAETVDLLHATSRQRSHA